MTELTAERLREMLHYNPETGLFVWVSPLNPRLKSRAAGTQSSHGYREMRINGRRYLAHRLAWLYVHGRWPEHCLDHVNGVRTDNRLVNLRDVPRRINSQNRLVPNAKNTTGLIGVSKDGDAFRASIYVAGRRVPLGSYRSPEEAHAAYLLAKRTHHPDARIADALLPNPQRITRTRVHDATPEIVRLRATGRSQRQIADITGVTQSAVCRVLKQSKERAHA